MPNVSGKLCKNITWFLPLEKSSILGPFNFVLNYFCLAEFYSFEGNNLPNFTLRPYILFVCLYKDFDQRQWNYSQNIMEKF